MNYFKKWKNYFMYRKVVKENKLILQNTHRLRVDNIYRMYTVLDLRMFREDIKAYGYYFLDNKVREYISGVHNHLKSVGLFEFVGLTNADQINDLQVFICIEYKFLNMKRIMNNFIALLSLITAGFIVAGIVVNPWIATGTIASIYGILKILKIL